ncbi:hypothetical protein F2P81_017476 [Scophthalmus maximus]|uniref:Uncharacterized protein n=1 Tax=Scophthalmus maximus TaxID=52904 RepID=A0A6A4SE11_SCOMX|nr:hypothetical protein F2P81_017476 [Scophthalmus maximus]
MAVRGRDFTPSPRQKKDPHPVRRDRLPPFASHPIITAAGADKDAHKKEKKKRPVDRNGSDRDVEEPDCTVSEAVASVTDGALRALAWTGFSCVFGDNSLNFKSSCTIFFDIAKRIQCTSTVRNVK